MAMNGTTLKNVAKTTIFNKLNTLITPTLPPGTDMIAAQAGWDRIATAVSDAMVDIVAHIQGNAVVSTNLTSGSVAVTSVTGVTTGGGTSGSGTGTVPTAATGTVA